MGLGISPTWTFNDIVENIKAIKLQYEEVLLSFSNYQIKEQIQFRKEARDSVYALNMQEWKKDRLWEYINDFLVIEVLQDICERDNKNGNKR